MSTVGAPSTRELARVPTREYGDVADEKQPEPAQKKGRSAGRRGEPVPNPFSSLPSDATKKAKTATAPMKAKRAKAMKATAMKAKAVKAKAKAKAAGENVKEKLQRWRSVAQKEAIYDS